MRKAFVGLLALFLMWALPGQAVLAASDSQKARATGKAQPPQKGKKAAKSGTSAKGKNKSAQAKSSKSSKSSKAAQAKSAKGKSGKTKSAQAKSGKNTAGQGKPDKTAAVGKGKPDPAEKNARAIPATASSARPDTKNASPVSTRASEKPANPAESRGDGGKPAAPVGPAQGPASLPPPAVAARPVAEAQPAMMGPSQDKGAEAGQGEGAGATRATPPTQAPDMPFAAGKMAMSARQQQAPRLGSSLVGPALATLAVAAAAGPEPAEAAVRPNVAPPSPSPAVAPLLPAPVPAAPLPVPAVVPPGASPTSPAAPPTRTASAKPATPKPAATPVASTKPRAAGPVCMPRDEALLGRRVMATVEWSPDYGTDLLCVASGGAGEAKRLECMALKKLNGVESVCLTDLVHEDFDWPLALYPLGDLNAHLLTVWAAGSAYHVRVFGVQDGKLKLLVDDGSRRFPEVVTEPGGEMGIIVTDYDAGPPGARTATLSRHYRWNGRLYDVTEVLPGRRFDKVR